jgi:hypothetical protein
MEYYSVLKRNGARCPTTDEWIKKMSYIHDRVLFNHKEE